MNIRNSADYSALFLTLDALLATELPQMELYQRIGEAICGRPEKGAAVAAAEYLQSICPDTAGFSPRKFFRTYQGNPALMAAAAKIGWTHNTVILEKCESEAERRWYIHAVQQFGWSKQKLLAEIANAAFAEKALDIIEEVCYTEDNRDAGESKEAAGDRNEGGAIAGDSNAIYGQERDKSAEKLYKRSLSGSVTDRTGGLYRVAPTCGPERGKETAYHYQHGVDYRWCVMGRRRRSGIDPGILSGPQIVPDCHPPPIRKT